MSDVAVSIITPCYNSSTYIVETIRSVKKQSFLKWEMVIIDDLSTDNSLEVIHEEIKNDSRFKLVKLTQNSGAAKARNKGIELAVGRYIAFLDSDDIWMPNYLETSLEFMKENDYEFIYSSYERRDENMQPLLSDFIVPDSLEFKDLLYNCPIFTSTVIYDTNRVGKFYYPIVDKREDHALYFNMLKIIPKAHGITNPERVWYRIHRDSYSRNKFVIFIKQFMVYYCFLNLSLHQSIYYTFRWAMNGLKKYEKL